MNTYSTYRLSILSRYFSAPARTHFNQGRNQCPKLLTPVLGRQTCHFTNWAQIFVHQPLFNTFCMKVMLALQCSKIFSILILFLHGIIQQLNHINSQKKLGKLHDWSLRQEKHVEPKKTIKLIINLSLQYNQSLRQEKHPIFINIFCFPAWGDARLFHRDLESSCR